MLRKTTFGLAAALALLVTAVFAAGAWAHAETNTGPPTEPMPDGLGSNDVYSCVFEEATNFVAPGVHSLDTDDNAPTSALLGDYDTGTYRFIATAPVEVECVHDDLDGATDGSNDNDGVYKGEIDSKGDYVNEVCGSGVAYDTDQAGSSTTLRLTDNLSTPFDTTDADPEASANPGKDQDYYLTFRNGNGVLNVLDANDDDTGVAGDGSGSGVVQIAAVPNDGEPNATIPCVTEDVTKFQVAGSFVVVTD